MGSELWSGQAQNWVNSDFEVKFDLEGQGQLPPKTIGTLTKVFCIFGPNLAILAWTGPELSPGQASDWHTDRQTDTHTHTQTQATTIPEGQNWPRVKIKILIPQVLVNTILHIQAQYHKNQIKPEGANLIWKKAERRWRTARHHYDEPHWIWSADNVGNRAKKKYLNRFLLKWMIDWLDLMSFLTEKSHIRQLSQHPTLNSRPCWQRKRLDQFT